MLACGLFVKIYNLFWGFYLYVYVQIFLSVYHNIFWKYFSLASFIIKIRIDLSYLCMINLLFFFIDKK